MRPMKSDHNLKKLTLIVIKRLSLLWPIWWFNVCTTYIIFPQHFQTYNDFCLKKSSWSTLLFIRVEKALPISWQSIDNDDCGVKRTKINRTGIWTSIRFGIIVPFASRTNPATGFFNDSNDPTIVKVPSVSEANLSMMLSFLCIAESL